MSHEDQSLNSMLRECPDARIQHTFRVDVVGCRTTELAHTNIRMLRPLVAVQRGLPLGREIDLVSERAFGIHYRQRNLRDCLVTWTSGVRFLLPKGERDNSDSFDDGIFFYTHVSPSFCSRHRLTTCTVQGSGLQRVKIPEPWGD